MKAWLGVSAVIVALSLAALAQQRGPAGSWAGEYTSSEGTSTMTVRVGQANGPWSVAVKANSAYNPHPDFQSATNVRIVGDTVSFALNWGSSVQWHGVVRGDSIVGKITADHWSGTWRAKREPKPTP